jgi:hypothetical protein
MCTKYADMAGIRGSARSASTATRLAVTAADFMLGRGLEILVREGGEVILENKSAAHEFILITALCRGLLFTVHSSAQSGTARSSGKVLFFLDDPSTG